MRLNWGVLARGIIFVNSRGDSETQRHKTQFLSRKKLWLASPSGSVCSPEVV